MKTKSEILKNVDKRIKYSQKVEKICRQLCEINGIEADRIVCKMMPELFNHPFIGGFYLPNPQFTMPAWWLYKDLVETTLKLK